jgi:hypothetical protein
MKVYVIVEHYDRGSDEVNIHGVYSSYGHAMDAIKSSYPGYGPDPEDFIGEDMPTDLSDIWLYADPSDASYSDRVMIAEQELNPKERG